MALAGFAGIVVVFRRREGRLHPADEVRVFAALVPSLVGAFLALLPVGLELAGLTPATASRIASGVLAGVIAALTVLIDTRFRRLSPEAAVVLSRPLTRFFYLLLGAAVVGNLLNAAAALGPPNRGVPFLSIVAMLAIGATVFARMVFIRPTA